MDWQTVFGMCTLGEGTGCPSDLSTYPHSNSIRIEIPWKRNRKWQGSAYCYCYYKSVPRVAYSGPDPHALISSDTT